MTSPAPQHAYMVECQRDDFADIVISESMLTDHFPWRYETALKASSGRRAAMADYSWY